MKMCNKMTAKRVTSKSMGLNVKSKCLKKSNRISSYEKSSEPDHCSSKTRVLIRQHVVPGDAASQAKVFRIRSGMDSSFRCEEAQPVSGCDLPVPPVLRDWQFCVDRDDHGIRDLERLGTDEVLGYPTQSALAQRGVVVAHERCEADIAGLRDHNCRYACKIDPFGGGFCNQN